MNTSAHKSYQTASHNNVNVAGHDHHFFKLNPRVYSFMQRAQKFTSTATSIIQMKYYNRKSKSLWVSLMKTHQLQ
jgi:hypothetical protein